MGHFANSNETWLWEPPVAYPNDNNLYTWDEATTSWKLVE